MLKRRIDFETKLTPDEVAEAFCDMGHDEQVVFFNELAERVAKWERPFCFQLQAVTDDEDLTAEARAVMAQIGEYAPK